jgi:hypothetical protein
MTSPTDRHGRQSRRQFLRSQAHSVAALGLGLAWVPTTSSRAADAGAKANPFAYDVSQFEKTDPALVRYREIRRFPSPQPDPRRLALTPDGNLLLAASSSLIRFSPDGATLAELPLPAPPHCVAASPEGPLYVGFQDHVEVLDAKGQSQATWPAPKGRPWISALALGANDLFVADAGNRLVLRYDRSGKLTRTIGKRDTARNVPGFVLPSPFLDVELHRDGLLRINNPGRHRVEAYTRDGEFELAWGKPSAAIDGFCGCCNPINLALLPDGRYLTCEKGLPRVKIYNLHGDFESVVAGAESFPEAARAATGNCVHGGLDAVVDAQGRVFVLDVAAANIRVLAPLDTTKA